MPNKLFNFGDGIAELFLSEELTARLEPRLELSSSLPIDDAAEGRYRALDRVNPPNIAQLLLNAGRVEVLIGE